MGIYIIITIISAVIYYHPPLLWTITVDDKENFWLKMNFQADGQTIRSLISLCSSKREQNRI